jgi:fructose-1,6-bisphosphatase/inositol monophosphatase family enzyme
MMVALVEEGDAAASWIYRPADNAMYVAIKGGGATHNGEPIRCQAETKSTSELRGHVLSRFLPDHMKQAVANDTYRFGLVGAGTKYAGVDYPAMVEKRSDFIVNW